MVAVVMGHGGNYHASDGHARLTLLISEAEYTGRSEQVTSAELTHCHIPLGAFNPDSFATLCL